jgi:hypothetical protein
MICQGLWLGVLGWRQRPFVRDVELMELLDQSVASVVLLLGRFGSSHDREGDYSLPENLAFDVLQHSSPSAGTQQEDVDT